MTRSTSGRLSRFAFPVESTRNIAESAPVLESIVKAHTFFCLGLQRRREHEIKVKQAVFQLHERCHTPATRADSHGAPLAPGDRNALSLSAGELFTCRGRAPLLVLPRAHGQPADKGFPRHLVFAPGRVFQEQGICAGRMRGVRQLHGLPGRLPPVLALRGRRRDERGDSQGRRLRRGGGARGCGGSHCAAPRGVVTRADGELHGAIRGHGRGKGPVRLEPAPALVRAFARRPALTNRQF